MFSKVLFAIDVEDREQVLAKLESAIDFAKQSNAELRVISVLPGFSMPIVASYFPEESRKRAVQDATKLLQKTAVAKIGEDDVSVIVREGRPHEQIIAEAKSWGADLIALTSHNNRMQEMIIGSVAERVTARAHCSVLVVR